MLSGKNSIRKCSFEVVQRGTGSVPGPKRVKHRLKLVHVVTTGSDYVNREGLNKTKQKIENQKYCGTSKTSRFAAVLTSMDSSSLPQTHGVKHSGKGTNIHFGGLGTSEDGDGHRKCHLKMTTEILTLEKSFVEANLVIARIN